MSDIFTLKSVRFTPELGMVFKNFRIERNVTATDINKNFSKASSYISKLEKGDIKKVDGQFLVSLCNYITKSEDGLKLFLNQAARNYTNFSGETKISLLNIDDLLVEHTVSSKMIEEINNYLMEHNISVQQLLSKINENEDILKKAEYDYNSLPKNIWYEKNSIYDHAAIKIEVPSSYLNDLLSGNISIIHKVIAHVVLYSMYKLNNEENPHNLTMDVLRLYKIRSEVNVINLSKNNVDKMLEDLDPDDAYAMDKVISCLKIATVLAKRFGVNRIQQVADNMDEDLGFYFSYISQDIQELQKNSIERKQEFLNDLRLLIKKYSQNESTFNIYD